VDEDGGREIERNYWMRGPRGGGAVLGGEIWIRLLSVWYKCRHICTGSVRYKCGDHTFVPGEATTRYKSDTFVLGRAPTRYKWSLTGGASGVSLPHICTRGQNTWYKCDFRPGTNAWFSSSGWRWLIDRMISHCGLRTLNLYFYLQNT
jgi:hypothetical protein